MLQPKRSINLGAATETTAVPASLARPQPHRAFVWRWLSVIAIIGLGTVAYANTFAVPFVFDDLVRIVDDPTIRSIWPPSTAMAHSNRPIANYTFALNYYFGGLDVWGFHFVNLAIHISAGLCLYGIVRRSCRLLNMPWLKHADSVAFAIGLLWTVHPLQTESVTYIVQRLESLMALAYLLTIYCMLRGALAHGRFSIGWYVASIAACAFGMGCKEVMVTAPIVVLWYDRVYLCRGWRELWSERRFYYLGLLSTWLVLAWSMLHYRDDYAGGTLLLVPGMTPLTYLISQSGVIAHYLRLAFWPYGLCLFYGWPVSTSLAEVVPQATLIAALLAATVWTIWKWPRVGFLAVSFFIILSPTSSIIPIKDLAFEHRMYLPLASIVALCVIAWLGTCYHLVRGVRTRSFLFLVPVVASALVLAIATYERNQVYATNISLWRDTVTKAPKNSAAWSNLGTSLATARRFDEASRSFSRSVELDPTDPKTLASLGGMLLEVGQREAADLQFKAALDIDPQNELALMNLGNLRLEQGRFEEAVATLERALVVSKRPHEIRLSLAVGLFHLGRFSESKRQCQQILDDEPNAVEAHVNMACALGGLGEIEAAIEHCETAIHIDPNSPFAYAQMATLLRGQDPALARQKLTQALALDPMSPDFNKAMGDLLSAADPVSAIPYYRVAVGQRGNDLSVRLNLAMALDFSGRPELAVEHLEVVTRLLPQSQEAIDCLNAVRAKIRQRPID